MAKAKFDIKTEATRPLYAYVGVTDRAVEAIRDLGRESVSDAQKTLSAVQTRMTDLDLEPKALRDQAVTLVNARVEALTGRAKALPERLQALLQENEATYTQLVLRGETLVERIRKQEATQVAASSGRTTVSKAKTTSTQAKKGAAATARTAKGSAERAASTTSTTARKQSARPRSSAKATGTTARKAAAAAGKATADATKKVGD